ncbi:hypothetical protein N656DRAFT_257398 [Canariomyces notabilis]|uniref:Uncharacterized protein n=1 Tax=Canariomyces notabilis TaxID=2074819 RepID=A0AAN6YWP6_9PEZI|nr:hypothetical protein N656DRAFT_257398 [Canariomyces arenarius]
MTVLCDGNIVGAKNFWYAGAFVSRLAGYTVHVIAQSVEILRCLHPHDRGCIPCRFLSQRIATLISPRFSPFAQDETRRSRLEKENHRAPARILSSETDKAPWSNRCPGHELQLFSDAMPPQNLGRPFRDDRIEALLRHNCQEVVVYKTLCRDAAVESRSPW